MKRKTEGPILRERGSVSMFLAISAMAVIALLGVLIEASRLGSARSDAVRAADAAASSALAQYDKTVRQDYGVFAVSGDDLLGGAVDECIVRNLVPDGGAPEGTMWGAVLGLSGEPAPLSAKLFDYQVEDVRVYPTLPLAAVDVIDRQILEFMKFRAPVSLGTGVIKKLRAASEVPKVSKPLAKKMDIDKRMEKVGKEQVELAKHLLGNVAVSGATLVAAPAANEVKSVEGFMADGYQAAYSAPIAEAYENYVAASLALRETEMESANLLPDEMPPDMTEALSAKAYALRDLNNGIGNYTGTLTAYLNANERAREAIGRMAAASREIDPKLDELENDVGESVRSIIEARESLDAGPFDAFLDEAVAGAEPLLTIDGPAGEIIGELSKSAAETREALLTPEEAEPLDGLLENNVAILHAELARTNGLLDELRKYTPPPLSGGSPGSQSGTPARAPAAGTASEPYAADYIVSFLTQPVTGYASDIPFEFDVSALPASALPDPRGIALDAASSFMDDTGLENKDPRTDLGIDMDSLPSRNMISGDGSTIDVSSDGGTPFGGSYGEDPAGAFSAELNFSDSSSNFAQGKLDMLSALGGLTTILTTGRDQLYRAEYALSVFNNAAKEPYMWSVDSVAKRDSFYQAEVEYLLHGHAKQSTNILITKAQLFGIRAALNLVHAYSDPEKVNLSVSIAASLVASWCAPLVPAVQALIMVAWSAVESYADVKALYAGESVPLIKTKSDWKTDIGLASAAAGAASGAQSPIAKLNSFTYLDYLRINLMFMDREKLVGRALDLFAINAMHEGREFDVSNMYCGVQVDLELSLDTLFVSSALMPKASRVAAGRLAARATVERDLF